MKTDNELIAEFMGAEFVRKPHVFYPDQYTETYIFKGHPGNWRVEKETKSHMTAPMLFYHTDWDWLIPVVEKIEALPEQQYIFTIFKSEVWLSNERYRDTAGAKGSIRFAEKEATKIESVYKSVVKFIKWYNSVISPTGK